MNWRDSTQFGLEISFSKMKVRWVGVRGQKLIGGKAPVFVPESKDLFIGYTDFS